MNQVWLLPLVALVGACSYEVDWRDPDDSIRDEAPPPEAPPRAPDPGGGGGGGTVVHVEGDQDAGGRPGDAGVARAKELFVVDPEVVADERFGFAPLMDRLSGDPARTPAFVEAWLRTFTSTRPGVEAALLAPWRAQATCGYGETCSLPMARAPFRLLAIVNRVDLAPSACAPGGELRFVYNALDPEDGTPLEATVALELPLPATQTAGDFARAWRALGSRQLGADYTAALAAITDVVLADATSAHVRTDEVAFAPTGDRTWELRDFVVRDGALIQTNLLDTPAPSLDGTTALGTWVAANPGAALPASMQGTSARTTSAAFGWIVPGVAPAARQAFSANTCNGCHGGDRIVNGTRVVADRLPFQHVAASAGSYGAPIGTVVSTYLDDGGADELGRRADVLISLAAASCSSSSSGGY